MEVCQHRQKKETGNGAKTLTMVVFKEEETLDGWKTETMTGEDGG